MDMKGKISLITGASAGQGAATARRLAAEGATVVLTDVDAVRGRAIAEQLGGPHRFIELDVTSEEQWAAVAAQVLRDFGQLDSLHLNAGLMTRPYDTNGFDDFMDWFSVKGYRKVASVNSDGVVLGLITMLPLLEQAGEAAVIVTSSTSGLRHLEWDPLYSMAKAGVISLVWSIAPLLAKRGITLTGLCPEGIVSEMCPPDLYEQRMKSGHGFGSVEFISELHLTILREGRPGELWLGRHHDSEYWVYPKVLPPAAGDEEAIKNVAVRTVAAPVTM